MKKIIFLLGLFSLSFLTVAPAQSEREAALESFTEYVDADSLQAAGDEFSNIFNQFTDDVKQNDKGPWGLVLIGLGVLSSFLGFMRKWWPFFARIFKKAKGDTVVLIFAFIGGVIWSAVDGQMSGEELVVRFGTVFTVAVVLFKAGLGRLWEYLFNRKKSDDPAPEPTAGA